MIVLRKACLALMMARGKAHELLTPDGLRLSADKKTDASAGHQDKTNESKALGHPDVMAAAPLLVDYIYTYGAPSVSDPYVSNPGNKCIPGIRAFTEDIRSGDPTCSSWWEAVGWCSTSDRVTNTDFAAAWNAATFPHPKMSTLVLILRDDEKVEYEWHECSDSDGVGEHQSLPSGDDPAGIVGNVHDIDTHYERRIIGVPPEIRGRLLEFTSVAWCVYAPGFDEMGDCLQNYAGGLNDLPGVAGDGWEPLAFMNYANTHADSDTVGVLKNDHDPTSRKCVIGFAGSESLDDFTEFLGSNSYPTDYCGSNAVHGGIKDELVQITADEQYRANIKPALETCHSVACVGHSLGGALCDLFTMCANQGPELLAQNDDADARAQYEALVWTKATRVTIALPLVVESGMDAEYLGKTIGRDYWTDIYANDDGAALGLARIDHDSEGAFQLRSNLGGTELCLSRKNKNDDNLYWLNMQPCDAADEARAFTLRPEGDFARLSNVNTDNDGANFCLGAIGNGRLVLKRASVSVCVGFAK